MGGVGLQEEELMGGASALMGALTMGTVCFFF